MEYLGPRGCGFWSISGATRTVRATGVKFLHFQSRLRVYSIYGVGMLYHSKHMLITV